MSLLKGLSDAQVDTIIPPDTFLLGYRGSIAHGMYVPNNEPNSIDDKDIMGICFAVDDVYFGLGNFEQREVFLNEWDSVIYEFKKFMRLLIKSNPNVMSMLWLRPGDYIVKTPAAELLISCRDLFATKEAYYSFTGYAYGQMHKMEHGAFKGYMGEKRKRLVEKFGYDTKNAAHLIRLLKMGIEFLIDGQLNVFRHDATQLLEIKNGLWTLDQVKTEARRLFILAEQTFISSKLPLRPDMNLVNKLVLLMMEDHLSKRCIARKTIPISI